MKNKKITIDCTPTWSALVPLFIEWLQSGSTDQKKVAREHLQKMANITHNWYRIYL